MKTRCTNRDHPSYGAYGAKGIGVCGRWLSFAVFLADMGERPPGTTLDRIDNSRGYEPGNCRWADTRTQSSNRSDNRQITIGRETLTLAEWSRRSGVGVTTIRARLARGLRDYDVVAAPIKGTSGFRGVTRAHGKWQAAISVGDSSRYLGLYDSPVDAAMAFDAAARALGRTNLNFPDYAKDERTDAP